MNLLFIFGLSFIIVAKNINCEKLFRHCVFYDESRQHTFNFTSLYKNDKDYVVQYENKNKTLIMLRMQICGPLKKECHGDKDYSSCLHIGSEEIGLGRDPDYIHEDGRIMFNFTGDKCKNRDYKLHVIMVCDHNATQSNPQIFPNDQDECTFLTLWPTILACGINLYNPVPPVNCRVDDKNGNNYDLSPLIRTNSNYIIPIHENASIILNVCLPVVYEGGAVCSDDSGACLRQNGSRIRYENIGTVSSLSLDGGYPVLHYTLGVICASSGNHKHTTVNFICDPAGHNTTPKLIGIENDCHYKLSWDTAAACSEKELKAYSYKTAAPCAITDPITNIEYNLNSLKGKNCIVKTKNGSEIKFSICENLLGKDCQLNGGNVENEAGVCSDLYGIGGKGNSKLIWNQAGPYLNYTNGSQCDNNKNRSTQIIFLCPHGSNTNFMNDDDPCNLRIYHYTSLVCNKKNIPFHFVSTLQESAVWANQSSVQSSSSTISPVQTDSPINHSIIKRYSGSTILIILIAVCGIFVILYLSNSERRRYLKFCCCSSTDVDIPMQYSRINTVDETDALLDTPDTYCLSDSDDDLLRI